MATAAYDAIFILGPQGSGKGTQQKLLAEKLGFYAWDTGKVLRENRGMMVPGGESVGQIIDSGRLLTDEQLLAAVGPLIEALPTDKGIIFDGIPRRIGQAEWLTDFLAKRGRARIATLLIDVPHEESMQRLLLRAEKEGRADDTREGIETRLRIYEEATVPMLPFLKERTAFFAIDGVGPIEAITQRIDAALGLA